MSRVTWSNRVGGLPQVDNARSVPRKPVIWFGEVWLLMPDGAKHSRGWRSHTKITRQQAQDNRPENLLICTHSYHTELHHKLENSDAWPEFKKIDRPGFGAERHVRNNR